METLAIELIERSKLNPRQKIGDVANLTRSIKAIGIVEPLIVTKNEEGIYVLVAGHRRLTAAKKAGLTKVPVEIRNEYIEDQQRGAAMLAENLQREDLTILEEAQIMFELSELGMKHKDIAAAAGVSLSTVAERLPLNNLPARVKKLVRDDQMRLTDAAELATLVDTPKVIIEILDIAEGPQGYNNYAGAIQNRQREDANQKLIDKLQPALDKLKTIGARILEQDEDVPRSWKQIGHEIDVDRREHRKLDCHGAGIRYARWATTPINLAEWCIKPGNHRLTGKSALKSGNAELDAQDEKKRRDANKKDREQRAAVKVRALELTKARYKVSALAPLFARGYVEDAHFDSKKTAVQILGTEVVLSKSTVAGNDKMQKNWYATIKLAIKQNGYEQMALAIMFGLYEPLTKGQTYWKEVGFRKWLVEQGVLGDKEYV